MLNVYFGDERFASEVSGFTERREFMPRFQERGLVNVKVERMDLNRAVSTFVPEDLID